MSKSKIRNLIIFLLVNVLLAVFIAINYFVKHKDDKKPIPVEVVSTKDITKQTNKDVTLAANNEAKAEPSIPQASAPVANISASPITKVEPTNTSLVCISMGPFNIEQKGTMETILTKSNQSELATVEKRTVYQVFWNLGSNKIEAEKIFKKQKDGAMADSKFVLTQNENKNWVVNIVKVNNSNIVIDKFTNELSEKAQKINAGGKWEYKTLPEGYFFIFKDFKKLSETTINSIGIILSPTKEPC